MKTQNLENWELKSGQHLTQTLPHNIKKCWMVSFGIRMSAIGRATRGGAGEKTNIYKLCIDVSKDESEIVRGYF